MVDLVAGFACCLMAFVTVPLMVCSVDLDFGCCSPVVQVVAVLAAEFAEVLLLLSGSIQSVHHLTVLLSLGCSYLQLNRYLLLNLCRLQTADRLCYLLRILIHSS